MARDSERAHPAVAESLKQWFEETLGKLFSLALTPEDVRRFLASEAPAGLVTRKTQRDAHDFEAHSLGLRLVQTLEVPAPLPSGGQW
jgi:hypothetical protein